MAPAEETRAEEPAKKECGCRRLLWIRKVHSACGLIFGAFLVEHLTATALGWKPMIFGRYVQCVRAVLAEAPWLKTLILIPLVVAVAFGGYLLLRAGVRYNVKKCNRGGKLRYWLQRMSAVALLLFLGFHWWTLRDFQPVQPLGPGTDAPSAAAGGASPQAIFAGSVAGFQATWSKDGPWSPWRVAAIIAVLMGTWAAVYHVSNGAWSAAIAWGLLETPASQRRGERICLAAGTVLAILGTMGWIVFSSSVVG